MKRVLITTGTSMGVLALMASRHGFFDGGQDPKVVEEITREIKSLGDNVKGLRDGAAKDLSDMRALAEEFKGKIPSEVKSQIDALSQSVATKLDEADKKATQRLDDIEKKMGRIPAQGGEKAAEERKSFRHFAEVQAANNGRMRPGVALDEKDIDYDAIKSWQDTEFERYLRAKDDRQVDTKAMTAASDPDGGYLIQPQISARIIQRIYETSPLRQLASVETISTSELEIPRDENEAQAGWIGETSAPQETGTPTLGTAKIVAYEMFAEPRATQKLLEDAAIDVESWLARKVSDKFSRTEATAFVSGSGTNKPRGFLTYADATSGEKSSGLILDGHVEQVVSGDATHLTADAFINLVHTLKEFYAANASFMMRRSTVRQAMLLKDGEGQYLFRPNLQEKSPSTILGYPIFQANDMPDVAAGSLAVAFADWKSFYTVVDRLGITVIRDALTAKPYVKFYSRKRVGGDVVNFEAGKLLKIAAS